MKKLAIIGASYLQIPLVQKAKQMGLETHCFAWDEGAVCKKIADFFYLISIVEKDEILKVCSEISINGIVSIASDLAVLTVNYVAEKLGLIANPNDYSLVTTNKFLMRECFFAHNVPSPRFFVIKDLMIPILEIGKSLH
jgi:phosphoribosylaminoimidazole carboxylase (NCAIR synthetase)